MAGKATSCYLTVCNRSDHKSVFKKMFFTMGELNKFVSTEQFKEKYPDSTYYLVKETY